MNKKLFEILVAKCKDMGLSESAVQQIAGIASNGLDDNAQDEEIEKRANQYMPVLQAMQSEATRWAQKKQVPPTLQNQTTHPKPNEAEPWKAAIEEIQNNYAKTLKEQNETIAKLQEQLAAGERDAIIKAEMKKLGLTSADMEFVTIPADAKVDEYLSKYKQSLVNRGLKPTDDTVTKEQKDKAESDMAAAMLKQFSVE